MRLLYITTKARDRFGGFVRSSIEAAKRASIEYHIASNESGIDRAIKDQECSELGILHHHIDIERSPAHILRNRKALQQVNELIDTYMIDAIHCNTPMGGVVGRLAGRNPRIKYVIYQAHGFHFWKGASLRNWLLYYPVEVGLSRWTDTLVAIAREDYELARAHMHAKEVVYVHGVGVDLDHFTRRPTGDRNDALRSELGIPKDSKVLLSVGELNKNKNHRVLLEAMRELSRSDCHYVVCGVGPMKSAYEMLAHEYGLGERVHLVGFRTDVQEFYRMADLFVFPSLREGIPGAIMEAAATGVPIIASDIRGVRDIVRDPSHRFDPQDADGLATLIDSVLAAEQDDNVQLNFEAIQPYRYECVVDELSKLYASAAAQVA